jgi:hypothetical protein
MKKWLFYCSLVFLFLSCSSEYKIKSIEIGEQRHIVGDHYDSDMSLCFEDNVGVSGFSFSMYVQTKDGRNFECKKDVIVSDPKSKCISFSSRPFFNTRWATEEDRLNMKSMARGNIKSLRIVIWNESFDKIKAEKTFYDL